MLAVKLQGASETALGIPELLESVLLHVDMTTLLVTASRVNKTWKTVIDKSPAIQQALFFRPVANEPSASRRNEGTSLWLPSERAAAADFPGPRRMLNPLLAEKFEQCFFDLGPTYSCHRRANCFYELPWTAQPVRTVQEFWGGWSQARPPRLEADAALAEAESRRRFTRRGASWRRMLVSQPPPPCLGYMNFDICSPTAEGQKVSSAAVQAEDEAGLRMGQLYDVVQERAGHHGGHALWFRVLWGRPCSAFAFAHVDEAFGRLMERAGVVVEFMQADDTSLPNHPRDPADVGVFDEAFRCEEFRGSEMEVEETLGENAEFPEFDPRFVVWHWKTEDDD
ncbi:hypothetical protein CCHL11_08698 [Colletotrichum chlorophyti]|uniref:F-box domain-containing protein n=1 Tax=Colletotrichum chlorophyti TaxID=708187 RepID=A0A1Q8RHB6_9PEZI|nr:hypothetical protein CCHL11_08698 [Colletotrichum chlorophyti]